MSAVDDWDYPAWPDDDVEMYIAEIGIRTNEAVFDHLDAEFRRFGQVESLVYFRANNTAAQRELVERLGLDWDTVDMPWLLVLDEHPDFVEPGDRAIIFRLGNLEEVEQVKDVTRTLMRAAREPDFMRSLDWEKRKRRFQEMLPAIKETANLVISVVGLGV